MTHSRAYWLTCVVAFLAVAASATTIILPTDAQLIAKSPLILIGTVSSSVPIDRDGTIWTETTIAVERTLKGTAGSTVTVREIGGILGNRITRIFGAPEYNAGERVLVFLTPTPRGDYQTTDLYVGKFSEQPMLDGHRVWQRDDEGADVTLLDPQFHAIHAPNVQRAATAFESYITDRVAGRAGQANYGLQNPVLQRDFAPSHAGPLSTSANFTLMSEPAIYRWFAFDHGQSVPWYSYGTQPGYSGGGVNEFQTAVGVWSNFGSAKIRYTYAGAESGAPGGLNNPNGVNEVLFNDPLGEIAGTFTGSGVVGEGGFNGVGSQQSWTSTFTADPSHVQGTFQAWQITEANLVIQDGVTPAIGVTSSLLAEICAHELGHTLGFGHSADPTALMYATVSPGGASLRPDDQLAAEWLYPTGSGTPNPNPNPSPSVPAAPTNLVATPAGANINLQWQNNATSETGQWIYFAVAGGSFTRIGDAGAGATSATLTGASAGTYQVYITAYNSAGESAPSNTATVTLGGTTPQPSPAPAAAFAISPSTGVAGHTNFVFTNESTGSVTSQTWNFGDGFTSGVVSPTHVFASAGTYSVTLTVSGSGGNSTASHTVTVNAPAPAGPSVTAAFSFSPTSPSVNTAVAFVDQSSGSPTSWSWSFGDGATSAAENPTHAFAAPGAYTVTLTASNAFSSAATSRSVTVAPVAMAHALVSVTAQTDGIGGSVWRTELTLFNAGGEAATGQFVFVPGAGGNAQTQPLYLAPQQSVTYDNALLDIFGLPSGAGAIAVEATSPTTTPNIKITSRTYTTGSNGTYGQAVPNVTDAGLRQTLFLTGLESDSNYRTNVGLVNRGATPIQVALTLLDGAGNPVGTDSVTLPANSFQQASLSSYFPAVAAAGYGALSMRSDASAPNAISVYASVIDNRTQDPVYIQGAPMPTGTSETIPAVGRAAGANGTYWRSDLRLFNAGSTTMSVTLRYLASGADNRNAQSIGVTILPMQTVVLADVLSQFGIASGSGALQLGWSGASGPVVASRTYTTIAGGGTYGQSIDALQSFGSDSDIPGLRSDGTYRSNAGFVNGSDSAIGVAVDLLSTTGQRIASAFVQLPPRSQTQQSLAALFPGVDVSSLGAVTLHAHTDNGTALFAYGSIIDNRSGDPVFYGGQ